MYRMRLIGNPRMVAEIPAPTVVEKSSCPATRAAIAVGGDIRTRSASMPSRIKKPLSLPKNSGMGVRLLVGMGMIARVVVCAAQPNGGERMNATSNPPASCNSLCETSIAKVQPVGIFAEHRGNELVIQIRSFTNFVYGSGKETIVMRKI